MPRAPSKSKPKFVEATQVRVLWTDRPSPGREPQTVDRDAGMALSELSPSAEIVKDKAIHSGVGIVHFVQGTNGYWREVDDPVASREEGWGVRRLPHDPLRDEAGRLPRLRCWRP